MKQFVWRTMLILVAASLLGLPALVVHAEQSAGGAPPIGQTLVREGTLALSLQTALGVGNEDDEAEAESRLAEAGVVPRNGWIADYPVTPDIVGELYKSVRDAAAAEKLDMGVEEALRRLNTVLKDTGLAIKPAETAAQRPPSVTPTPPPTSDMQDFYADEGPPVVTYYAPPQPYYTMYTWVPYPFWWSGFWFGGFFVLNDFHRPIFIGDRPYYISNHFRDIRRHRVFRIDPYQRYRGRTYTGIGIRGRGGIPTGVRRSERTIFNRSQPRGEGRVPGERRAIVPRGAAPGGAIERTPHSGGAAPGGSIETAPRSGAAPGGRVDSVPRRGTESAPRSGAAPGGHLESPHGDGAGGERMESVPRGGGMGGFGRGGGVERGGGGGLRR